MGDDEREEVRGGRVMGLRDGGRGRSESVGVLEMWKRKRELEEGAKKRQGKKR